MRHGTSAALALMIISAFLSAALSTAHAQVSGPGEPTRPEDNRRWYKPVELSAQVGSTFSRFGALPGVEQAYRIQPSIGMVVRFRILGTEWQTGASYARKGGTLENQEFTADYLTFPLLYRFGIGPYSPMSRTRVYGLLGPYVSRLVGGTFNADGTTASKWDYGANLGLGVGVHATPGVIVDIELQYQHGLLDLLDGTERTNRAFLLGLSGTWDLGGDADADGRLNYRESSACWRSAEDWDNFENRDGCADPDNDDDKVPDVFDVEPNIKEDPDGFEDWDGKPDEDNDEDGVPDARDKCPDEPFWGPLPRPSDDVIEARLAQASPDGAKIDWTRCFPEYKTFDIVDNGKLLVVKPAYSIQGFNDKELPLGGKSPARDALHEQALAEIAEFLTNYPWVSLTVQGHINGGDKNPDLGFDRAETIVTHLAQKLQLPKSSNRLIPANVRDYFPLAQGCLNIKKVKKPEPPVPNPRIAILEKEFKAASFADEDTEDRSRTELAALRVAHKRKVEEHRRKMKPYRTYEKLIASCSKGTGKKQNRRVTFEVRAD